MPADLKDLEDRIAAAQKQSVPDRKGNKELQQKDQSAGMRAGSEFMSYIFAGGVVGWTIGHFFGNTALWLILMLFAGFGWGTYRAYRAMNEK